MLVTPLLIEPASSRRSPAERLSWLRGPPYLPFTAGMRLVGAGLAGASEGQSVLDPFKRWEGGLVFAGFTALLLAIAWILFERRDARGEHPTSSPVFADSARAGVHRDSAAIAETSTRAPGTPSRGTIAPVTSGGSGIAAESDSSLAIRAAEVAAVDQQD